MKKIIFCGLLTATLATVVAAGEFYRLDLAEFAPGTVLVRTDASGKPVTLRPTWGMWPRTPDKAGAKVVERDGVKALEIKPRLPRKLAGAVTRPDGNGKRIASGTGYKCFGLFGIGINGFAGRNGFLDPGEPSEFGFDPDPPVMGVLHDASGDGHILLKRQV